MNEKISYKFNNPELYEQALTHKSFSLENNNERMEFLGDAVLDLVVTEYIFINYRELQEGELAKMRADVVCSSSLAEVADFLDLSSHLLLGKGEKSNFSEIRPSILGNATEALIAAIYLDGGLSAVKPLILDWFGETIKQASKSPGMSDYKSRLQELVAKKFESPPQYEITSKGPDHNKFYYARVKIEEQDFGEGEGYTKKEATQRAAQKAYEALKS